MRLAIALLSAAVLAAPRQDKQEIRAACTAAPDAAKGVKMRIEGKGPFEDGTKLQIFVTSMTESVDGRSIASSPWQNLRAPNLYTTVKDSNFSYEHIGAGPGRYRVLIRPAAPSQIKPVVLYVVAWDDKVIENLKDDLDRGEKLAKEASEWIKRCEKAAVTERTWNTSKKSILPGLEKIFTTLSRAHKDSTLKAGHESLSGTMFKLSDDAKVFKWKDGKLVPGDDYGDRESPLDNEWNFKDFKTCLEDANNVLGREAALWFLKDFKRRMDLGELDTAGKLAKFYGYIKQFQKHPVVGKFVKRLLRLHEMKPEEIKALEKEIRG